MKAVLLYVRGASRSRRCSLAGLEWLACKVYRRDANFVIARSLGLISVPTVLAYVVMRVLSGGKSRLEYSGLLHAYGPTRLLKRGDRRGHTSLASPAFHALVGSGSPMQYVLGWVCAVINITIIAL